MSNTNINIIAFLIGFFIGSLFIIAVVASDLRMQAEANEKPKENISLCPRQLPRDIEFDEIKVPTNLKEVIL